MGSFLGGILGVNNDTSENQNDTARKNQIFQQQQGLSQMLQQQAAGNGPNPSQTQYLQNNQNNIANAQGMISSQRGLNPALAAKLGANIGSQANQQAGMNAALLQQQQQLGAQNALSGLYGQEQQGNLGAMSNNTQLQLGNQKQAGQLVGGLVNGAALAAGMADGGMVDGPQSFAGQYLANMAKGGMAPINFKPGGRVPGKAAVRGDSLKNDTVPAMLSPGEVVVPRSVMNHDDAPSKAARFVSAVMAKENLKKKKK